MENTQIGPFYVIEKLGSHRRHQVYHAKQTEQDRDVAIKFIKVPKDVSLEKVLKKIQIESDFLKNLSHPNLVRFYGAGIVENQIFLASKLVKGESLSAMLSRQSRFAPDTVIDYARQIALSLDYLHEVGLVHSKLTPDKILVDRRGVVRLIDVRLNRAKKRRWDAPRRHQLEIAAYMAPEVLMSKGCVTRSDFYSLGVIMYEMLTGELPFELETLGRIIRRKKNDHVVPVTDKVLNCPPRLDQFVVQQLLNPQLKLRPQTAEDIARELADIKAAANQKTSIVQVKEGKITNLQLLNEEFHDELEQSRPSYFQSLPFLASCLAILFAVMIFFAWPENNQKLFERAESYRQSDKIRDWERARDLYQKIVHRNRGDDVTTQAEARYYDMTQQLLVQRALVGDFRHESSLENSFVQAFQFEQRGQYEIAVTQYQKIRNSISHDNNEFRHIYREVTRRIADLNGRIERIAETTIEIDEQILNARRAKGQNRVEQARDILQKIIDDYSDDFDLRHWVNRAKNELNNINSNISLLAEDD